MPVDCTGRADAQLKEPQPLWCNALKQAECERHFVYVKREKRACNWLEGQCGSFLPCRANATGASRPKKQEAVLQRAAARWLTAAYPEAITVGQPGFRLRAGFPDLFVYEAGAAGEHGLGIEFKVNTTRLSAAQRQMRNHLIGSGYAYRVVRSLPEFRWSMRDYMPVLPGAAQCYSGLVERGRAQTCNRLSRHARGGSESRRLQHRRLASLLDRNEVPDKRAAARSPPPPPPARISRAAAFHAVFSKKLWGVGAKKHIWGRGDTTSGRHRGSGAASTLPATLCTREALVRVLRWVATQIPEDRPLTMLDVPCGDLTWMPTLWQEHHQAAQRERSAEGRTPPHASSAALEYHGLDIVAPLIERHQRSAEVGQLASQSGVRATFNASDIVSTPLARPYDLVFTKDMTIHLRTEDALQVFRRIAASGSRFLLATTNPSVRVNRQLPGADDQSYSEPGAGRDLNLELPPFNFSAPLCRSMQFRPTNAQMHLWDLQELRTVLV